MVELDPVMPVENQYVLTVTAEGEVRDADGNLVGPQTLTGEVVVSESQLKTILEGQNR